MNYLPEKIADKVRHARQVVELQSRDTGEAAPRNPDGSVVMNFSTYARPWACVEMLSGKDLERAKSFGADVAYKLTMRYLPNITEQDRIIWQGHTLLINAVIDPMGSRRYLEIFCTESR